MPNNGYKNISVMTVPQKLIEQIQWKKNGTRREPINVRNTTWNST